MVVSGGATATQALQSMVFGSIVPPKKVLFGDVVLIAMGGCYTQ